MRCDDCGTLRLALFEGLVALRPRDNIGQKLEIVDARDGVGHVLVLDVSPRLPLRLDHVVTPFDQILDEHFGGHGNYECGIVGARADVVVGGYNLLDASD